MKRRSWGTAVRTILRHLWSKRNKVTSLHPTANACFSMVFGFDSFRIWKGGSSYDLIAFRDKAESMKSFLTRCRELAENEPYVVVQHDDVYTFPPFVEGWVMHPASMGEEETGKLIPKVIYTCPHTDAYVAAFKQYGHWTVTSNVNFATPTHCASVQEVIAGVKVVIGEIGVRKYMMNQSRS